MSKKLLTAALTTLCLVACDEPAPPTLPRSTPVLTAQALPRLVDAGRSMPDPIPLLALPDAALDPLALVHDTPQVDHLGRSQQLLADGDPKGGLVEARRALFTTPDDDDTLTQVAKLARRTGQHQLAAEAWGRLARLRDTDATPVIQQSRALLAAKDFAGAVVAGREAVTRDAGNFEGYQVTGLAQLSLGELPGAIASFEQGVEQAPHHGWALNNLGFAYLLANENAQAVEVLERAAALLPTVAAVQNNLGVALERLGRGDEAKAAYLHAMDLSPRYVKARVNAARVARAPQAVTAPADADPQVDEVPADAHPVPSP